jgi:transcription initiation factor TFIIIB Brf1 subunit/transcription initiation factor TFIIB
MTENEHRLMVFMFTRQTMLFRSLVELLKSRGVLESDDVAAFESLVVAQETSSRETLVSVVDQYSRFARELGLQGSLPRAQKP